MVSRQQSSTNQVIVQGTAQVLHRRSDNTLKTGYGVPAISKPFVFRVRNLYTSARGGEDRNTSPRSITPPEFRGLNDVCVSFVDCSLWLLSNSSLNFIASIQTYSHWDSDNANACGMLSSFCAEVPLMLHHTGWFILVAITYVYTPQSESEFGIHQFTSTSPVNPISFFDESSRRLQSQLFPAVAAPPAPTSVAAGGHQQ